MQARIVLLVALTANQNSVAAFVVPSNRCDRCSALLAQSNKKVTNNAKQASGVSGGRKPAFPRQSYPLIKDEEDLKHTFISFIDQSITSSYSQTVRLVEPRFYAKKNQFLKKNANVPPTIDDLSEPKSSYGRVASFLAWNGLPARIIVGTIAYFVFPFAVAFLESACKEVDDNDLATLTNTFLPGISIVLGTYFSLTITILYDRYSKMQEVVNLEASVLASTCNSLLYLFENDQEKAVEAAQSVADQVRTMVFDSRGKETMGVIYNDPYARIQNLIRRAPATGDNRLLSALHTSVGSLCDLRSKRMTYESLALAPTHFDVMTFLCGMLLTGFALGTVATAQVEGVPTEISRFLFSSLVVCYTIFYEMSFDLNRPFDGIYQLRRSGTAVHFLQIKHLLCNHPLVAGLVDFDEVVDEEEVNLDCDDDCKQRKAEIWYN